MSFREGTKKVKIGNVTIGAGLPIAIQSMTNTRTKDIKGTAAQIRRLEDAGCDIVRCTVPDKESALAISKIKEEVSVPIVADIHFDYRLAVLSMENGADKIRINPGNIGSEENVRSVVACAMERQIPIRVGVNSGSLEKDILKKYGAPCAEALSESALRQANIIEDMGYDNLVISIKSTDVLNCVRAHELIAAKTKHPLHIGITEAGTPRVGSIRSAVGLGVILYEGIGDTIRVSLTGDPVLEVETAKEILKSLRLKKGGISVISCPTCGRTEIDLVSLANRVEELAAGYDLDLKLAVMGCVVNGPGEAREADLGIAGGKGCGIIIKKGEIIGKFKEKDLLPALKKELDNWNLR